MRTGRLDIIGLGPGPREWMTVETSAILETASDLVGYATYLDRIPVRDGQARHASDNRDEIERAQRALALAASGCDVAVVSSGDPGIFAMAAAIFEAVDSGEPAWRNLDIAVHPGVSAMLAAAARLGAPLGHDFCAISLSDNLKPWSVIERRLRAAAEADFVIALYNPASQSRPRQIHDAFALLRTLKPAATITAFAWSVGGPDERLHLTTLAAADPSIADMRTLVLVGSSETRAIARGNGGSWVYTPRRYGAVR